ncbi:hypothetical protein TsFJ059_000181 [Trichoderma semiorbis]|uniref:Uncharacterized protein n=1 Tax=Trichoderma semiorbis TaxID=1491008 RepID=A0A9P8KYJ0_9HYPO|nr:hypothetical protein TsFJ059_000181 [Trichoderma semiorbis]
MSTSHHNDLELLLVDNNIFPEGFRYPDSYPAPELINLDTILDELSVGRCGQRWYEEKKFRMLQHTNHSLSRSTIMRRVIPILKGSVDDIDLEPDTMNDGGTELDNLNPLVEGVEVVLQPDYFDGVPFTAIDRKIRDALGGIIIPSKHIAAPIAPNFFLEVRKPSGNAVTTKMEACYYGACGARLMHAIQNYGQNRRPKYDEKAYSFSSTYINGLLKIYAHFIVEQDHELGELPGYHMFELKAFNMTNTYDDFINGCCAFRNVRELAAQFRNDFITDANARSRVQCEAAN